MTPIKKVAILLMMIGVEKGQRIIELMDNDEIKVVIPAIHRLTTVSPEIQQRVLNEFKELGYEDKMKPVEVLTILRFLFNGSKINNKGKR